MAIDKIIPIRLDKSSDFKLVPKTSMVDALNMLITENESSGEANETGNLGVLKNIKGNAEISYLSETHAIAAGDSKIIGSVTDTKLKIIYFFVWHTNALEHGVYAYDQMGKLPISGNTRGKIVRIHKSDLYAFPEHGYVKGNIIYTSQTRLDDSEIKPGVKKDFEKDAILYFTDNTNEPRKLNVYQAMLGADSGYLPEDKIDFITACPKTPLTPITFNFSTDPTRTTSNFKSGPGLQFAYQFISKDGVESAISPYSDIAFSPGVINQGTKISVNPAHNNRCILRIPLGGEEIKSIRILARQFNNSELVILDEVSNIDENLNFNPYWVLSQGLYFFYNDRIFKGVSSNEVNKQYDNLPRKAQAQSVVDNRLMYGNYLEGFNKVETNCSSVVTFEERGLEFLNLAIDLIPAISEQRNARKASEVFEAGGEGSSATTNKSAGYVLDGSEIPDVILAGTVVNITISMSPNNNFHVYQASNSYHQSRHKGAFRQSDGITSENQTDYSDPETFNGGIYGNEEYGHQDLDSSGATWIKDSSLTEPLLAPAEGLPFGIPYKGDNRGVGGAIFGGQAIGGGFPKWKTVLGTPVAQGSTDVKYGTSAGNPLILAGGSLFFSCGFTVLSTLNGNGKAVITKTIAQLLAGVQPNVPYIETSFANRFYEHKIDFSIPNFSKYNEGTGITKLIVGAVSAETNAPMNPVGHFIVSKADVTFGIERDEYYSTLDGDSELIRLVVSKIENVETVSMIKKKFLGSPWIALTKQFLQSSFTVEEFTDGTESIIPDIEYSGETVLPGATNTMSDFSYSWPFEVEVAGQYPAESQGWFSLNVNYNLQRRLFIGYLDFEQTDEVSQFFRYNRAVWLGMNMAQETYYPQELFPFSLVDGEGGPGAELPFQPVTTTLSTGPNWSDGDGSKLSSSPRRVELYRSDFTIGEGTYLRYGGPFFLGIIDCNVSPWNVLGNGPLTYSGDPFSGYGGTERRSYLPLMQGTIQVGLNNPDQINYPYSQPYSFDAASDEEANQLYVDFSEKQSHIELLQDDFNLYPNGEASQDRTFKSSANHDFGIIYYDERGRHGFVDHLTTVYVPGYSQQERGGAFHGRSIITLTLNYSPPDWAHYYKIAYSKNTSVQSFIQYSVGGAKLDAADNEDKIYVSLNYLQESSISYVADWGARTPEGGLSMFKYTPGANQKLRIISSYIDVDTRKFYYNHEFDIIDVVLLGDNEENPLGFDDNENDSSKQGEFVILKNNPVIDGFNSASILNNINRWESNCIVELYTPSKVLDIEDRFYYEIGDTYAVNNPGLSNRAHSMPGITLTKGDVWWRKIPVNFREYDQGDYIDLIQSTVAVNDPNPSSSNFKPYYLETETASDLFKADATLIGRPNIIVDDAVETIRESSITYSGKSNPNSSKINYSSFNLTLFNFKSLQEEFGDINYMCNMEGDVFVIQSDRCTLVPASKTLFSDVQGSSTVAASKSPLGQERVFAGRAGCDNNPESVVQVGAYVYFAHKNLGKVYRFNPANGIQEISDQGMASYFRDLFKAAMNASESINYNDVRVVGGFDPVNEEYLLTVLDPVTYGVTVDDSEEEDPEDDDGGDFPLAGCTNPEATNYDPDATIDDGSCILPGTVIQGCMNSSANNYNPAATQDDGSCLFDDEVLPVYTGNPCDYPSIIDEEGNITVLSIQQGWSNVNAQLVNEDITQAEAANLFPDYNGDNVWNIGDLQAMLLDSDVSSSLPIVCVIGPDGGGPDGGGPDVFGDEGILFSRPPRLFVPTGLPVIPSKDREDEQETEKY